MPGSNLLLNPDVHKLGARKRSRSDSCVREGTSTSTTTNSLRTFITTRAYRRQLNMGSPIHKCFSDRMMHEDSTRDGQSQFYIEKPVSPIRRSPPQPEKRNSVSEPALNNRRAAYMEESGFPSIALPDICYDSSHDSVPTSPISSLDMKYGTASRSKKKASFWFTRMGKASKTVEEVGKDIQDILPALACHTGEALDAIRDASMSVKRVADGIHDNIISSPENGAPGVLNGLQDIASGVMDLLSSGDLAGILKSIHVLSRLVTGFALILGPALIMLVIVLIFYLLSGVTWDSPCEGLNDPLRRIFLVVAQLVCIIAFATASVLMAIGLASYGKQLISDFMEWSLF